MAFSSMPPEEKNDSVFEQALAAHRAGETARAEDLYRALLRGNPDHVPALVNLAVLLKNRGLCDTAIALYTRARGLKPDNNSILMNLGNALMLKGNFEAALKCHEQIVKAKAGTAEVFYNRALTMRCLGRLSESIFSFERSLSLQPGYVDAEWDRALTLLMGGDYRLGLSGLESRWKLPGAQKPTFSKPQWSGSDPKGKTILLYTEENFSDTFLFLRFASFLKERGASIILHCQPELVNLLKHSPAVDEVYAFGDAVVDYDFHAPLLSLPYLMGATSSNIFVDAPYMYAPPTVEPLEFLQTEATVVKVGLVWAANEKAAPNHYNRSCGFAPFLKLLEVPNVHFYSLQVGEHATDPEKHGVQGIIRDLSPFLNNYEDLAKTIDQLDLLIAVDSAVIHLAGAMGIPTWTPLPVACDWYWGTTGDRSDWYPTLRHFRQKTVGQWDDVFAAIVKKLYVMANTNSTPFEL